MKSFSHHYAEKDFSSLIIINFFFIVFFAFLSNSNLISGDIREFEIGNNIKDIPNFRYTNIKCFEDGKKIKYWKNYKRCNKNSDGLYYISFEYNDKYAFNENFEGTQVAGHPVKINLGINSYDLLSKINVSTDPTAPFYFKKQAHLFWLRIYAKFGSDNWTCENFEKKNNHLIINKKYVNKSCYKIYNNKKITYKTQFYFTNDRKKENLTSSTTMSISASSS